MLRLVKTGDERGDAPITDIVGMLRKLADRLELLRRQKQLNSEGVSMDTEG